MEPGRRAARELRLVQSPAPMPSPWWHVRCGCHRLAVALSGYGFPHQAALGENVLTRPLWQSQAWWKCINRHLSRKSLVN